MGAAAQLDRIGRLALTPRTPAVPIDTTRTSSPYFSPNSAMAPSAARVVGPPSGGWSTGAFCRMRISLAMVSTSRQFLGRHRLGMREVEAQPVGRDQRALLRHMGRQAPRAAPRAADAWPNGWRGSCRRARMIDLQFAGRRRGACPRKPPRPMCTNSPRPLLRVGDGRSGSPVAEISARCRPPDRRIRRRTASG
jgi:hypothetical protein